jgi:hypothetical protein
MSNISISTDQIRITEYSQKYRDQVISFLKHKWSNISYQQRYDLFAWRYEKNPYVNEPLIYIALYNDEIIGVRAYVVQKFVYNKLVFNVASAADAVVHPSFRNMGIFSKLNKYSVNHINDNYELYKIYCILNLSSNELSTHLNLKHGWKPLGIKHNYIKYSLYNVIRNYYSNAFSEELVDANANYKIFITKRLFINSITQLINRLNYNNIITNLRDANYYQWRYRGINNNCYFIYCYYNRAMVGYMIIKRLSTIKFSIEEYRCNDSECFIYMINAAFKKIKISAIKVFRVSNNPDVNLILSVAGFNIESKLSLKIKKKKQLPALINIVASTNNLLPDEVLLNPDNWELYAADIH